LLALLQTSTVCGNSCSKPVLRAPPTTAGQRGSGRRQPAWWRSPQHALPALAASALLERPGACICRPGGMAAVRQYRFRAQMMPSPAALEGLARGFPSAASPIAHTCCLIEPSYHRYFPAALSRDEELPPRPGAHVVVTIALTDGEAEAFFAPGQRFAIWSDAVVGHTVSTDGLVGYGVISRPSARAA